MEQHLPVLTYEGAEFVVLNKPSGLLTHPKNAQDTSPSVSSWLREKYPQVKNVGDDPSLRPGIVHRLDKETSGIMIAVLSQSAYEYFKLQFQERKIKKTYLALVYGNVKKDVGTINAPLGKLGTRQSVRIHGKKELNEKNAITHFKVLMRYSEFTLLEIKPQTGRTHQIRVHLKSIGNPVVCDVLYGGKRAVCPEKLGRLFLHSHQIGFKTPSGQVLTLESDLPLELENFLNSLAK